MDAQVKQWIDKALEDAAKQSWSKAIRLDRGARADLEDWAEDGMFKNAQQVRDRLCQWADQQIGQVGVANFRCGEKYEVVDGDGSRVSTHLTREEAQEEVTSQLSAYAQTYQLAAKESGLPHFSVREI